MLIRGWSQFYAVSYDPRMPMPLQMKIIAFGPDADWVKEFKERLAKAGEVKQSMIDLLSTRSVLIAEHDSEVGATILKTA